VGRREGIERGCTERSYCYWRLREWHTGNKRRDGNCKAKSGKDLCFAYYWYQ